MTHVREHHSILAAAEKRLLIFLAKRLPRAVNSDHLTALALFAMGMAGAAFAATWWDRRALWLVVAALALNWFGDSLDGTLARVRRVERPRYGFYVDHVLDIAGATLLLGGLACSPFMSPVIAFGVLVAYLLVSGEVFLATAVRGVFKMSVAGFGPTELRIALAIGAVALFHDPRVAIGPLAIRLFDFGGAVAALGLIGVFVVAVRKNATALATAEPR
jgi:phosphatidylglycerophosphate synthase